MKVVITIVVVIVTFQNEWQTWRTQQVAGWTRRGASIFPCLPSRRVIEKKRGGPDGGTATFPLFASAAPQLGLAPAAGQHPELLHVQLPLLEPLSKTRDLALRRGTSRSTTETNGLW